jgi:hypothetical protein
MKTVPFALLSIFALAGLWLRAEPAAVTPPGSPADPLTEVLPVLMMSYPDFPALNYKPGDKLEDLIARSHGGISLVAGDAPAPTPIITVTLPDGTIYWRLASFIPRKDWTELGNELEADSQRNPGGGAILDLRSNETPQDIASASQMMTFFDPADTTLMRYHLKDIDGTHSLVSADVVLDRPFHGPLVVLTNQETTGAAEALAACLKADGALVVGAPTAGQGAAFAERKLASGQILRFVTDHVHLPPAGHDLWDHPVTPDINIAADSRAEKSALTLIRDNHILDVIQESAERHRMSEASLVQGQDPEMDEYLASLEQKPVLLSLPVVHDVALISALDSLKAIHFAQGTAPAPATTTANAAPPASASVQ